MQHMKDFCGRGIAVLLVAALLAPVAGAEVNRSELAGMQMAQAASAAASQDVQEEAKAALPDTPAPQEPAPAAQNPAPAAPEAPQTQQDQQGQQQPGETPKKPLGTAASPYEKTLGVPASRPAGAVIAPAKQRRVRTLWISVAAVVGAGIAVGTVVGLSKASSARP